MPPFLMSSLRGGINNVDPPISLADDQVVEAMNVEFIRSELGERRRGSAAIDDGGNLLNSLRVVWMHRHLPDGDERNAQLWVWWTEALTSHLAYKDTTWHEITVPDALTLTSPYPYRITGASLHGKLFIFYKSSVDRSHVFDPNTSTTTLRRVGMEELTTAPTAADSGGGGSLGTTRYYRVREIVEVNSVAYLRSEPSDVLTFTPDGTHDTITVTKPTTVNSDPAATHWELEESINNADFYRIATVAIGTTTYSDTNTPAQVTTNFTLSDEIGDYTPPGSYQFGVADDDRLVYAYLIDQDTAQVAWTPVGNATGIGNDERIPLDPESTVSLQDLTGGGIRAISRAVAGEIWAFKNEHIYKLNRTGRSAPAYSAMLLTSSMGACRGSVIEFVTPDGSPAVFFADPAVGPCLAGRNGILRCGQDIFATWKGALLNATNVTRVLFYPEANQIHLWIAWVDPDEGDRGGFTLGATTTLRLVLQVNEMRLTEEGWRRGWTIWDGDSAQVHSVCLFSENIDDDTNRSVILRPFMGLTNTILRGDTGDDDNGTAYTARIITKPYAPTNLQQEFELKSAVLVGKAVDGATLAISAIPNGGVTTTKLGEDIDCSPEGDETFVVRVKDELSIAEMRTLQLQMADTATPGARWELARLSMNLSLGQEA